MGAKSDYLENKAIDALLRGQAFPTIATVYIGLVTANPTTPESTAGATEVPTTGGTNYGRCAVATSLTNWKSTQNDNLASTGSTGTTTNSVTIAPGAGNSVAANGTPTNATVNAGTTGWGQIVGFEVFDALTGGNLLFSAPLATPKTVNAGDPVPTFAPGALTYTDDN